MANRKKSLKAKKPTTLTMIKAQQAGISTKHKKPKKK